MTDDTKVKEGMPSAYETWGLDDKPVRQLVAELHKATASPSPKLVRGNLHNWARKTVEGRIVMELARRAMYEGIFYGRVEMSSSEKVQDYLMLHLSGNRNEVFTVLYLDNQHRLIASENLSSGTLDEARVYLRVLVNQVLHYNAAAIILAHNHPSGITVPSQSDIRLTQDIKKLLDVIRVRVLDHFIVGESSALSMASMGLV